MFLTTKLNREVRIKNVHPTQSCPTLCDPMDCSMPDFPVLHHLPKLVQTHVHWVSDAIQPSHPLSSPSPPAFNLSQHQSFLMSHFFASSGQSIGASVSASFLPMNIQDWFFFFLRLTGWISLLSKGLSKVFPNTTVQKHQFFSAQPSLWSNSYILTNNLLIHGFTLSRNWCRKRIQEPHPYLILCPPECYLYSTGGLSPLFRGVMYRLRHSTRPTLCNPMACSPPDSSVHGILPAGILESVVMPSSRGSSLPQDWNHIYCIAGGFFAHWAIWEAPRGAIDPCKNVNYAKPLNYIFSLCRSSWIYLVTF